jgi:hypothetical protein
MSTQSVQGSHTSHYTLTSLSPHHKRYTLCSIVSAIGRAILAIFKAFIHLISFGRDLHAHKPIESSAAEEAPNLEPSNLAGKDESVPVVGRANEEAPLGLPPTIYSSDILSLIDSETTGRLFSMETYKSEKNSDQETSQRLNQYLFHEESPFVVDHRNKISDAIQRYRHPLTVQIEEITHIPQPTAALMVSVATHYKHKYKVDIVVVKESNFSSFIKSYPINPNPCGIIVRNNDDIGHVVPVIIINNGTTKQATKLDVLGFARDLPITPIIVEALRENSYEIFSSVELRQVDQNSCRTEALTILRNMLLYLKKHNISNFNRFSEDYGRLQIYEHGATIVRITIPVEVDYVDQISGRGRRDLDTLSTIRTNYSAKEAKRTREESVESFRDRYKMEVKFIRTLELNVPKPPTSPDQVISQVDAKRKLTINYNSPLTITEEEIKPINIYLALKAYRYALKFAADQARGIPIPRLFNDLLRR